MFAVEVSLGTVLAFLIVRRFMPPAVAFLATVPAIFFTTVLYNYSNFNFDSQVLFLAAFLLLVWDLERERWPLLLAAGVLTGLAFLAKPTYLAMAVGIVGLGILWPLTGGPRRWWIYGLGFVIAVGAVLAVIAGAGLWPQFRAQSFGQLLQARPVSKRQLIYQDWPTWLFLRGHAVVAPAAAAALLGLAALVRRFAVVPIMALAGALVLLIPPAVATSTQGIPTNGQMGLLVAGLALVLAINLSASVVTVAARFPAWRDRAWAETVRATIFPPVVPIVAAALEYLHGVDLSSMRFAYVGTFLGVPVAISFLYMCARLLTLDAVSRVAAPAVVGAFVVVAGAVVTHGSPYLDGSRAGMTATFDAPRLAGLSTVPTNADHVDGVVALIDKHTQPGDRTLVFPDGQVYYVVTGRHNPTKVDWYDILATTPAMSDEAARTLQQDPPQWIFVQEYNESDIGHAAKLDFESQPAWKPVFDFISANYDLVETVDGVDVYRLK